MEEGLFVKSFVVESNSSTEAETSTSNKNIRNISLNVTVDSPQSESADTSSSGYVALVQLNTSRKSKSCVVSVTLCHNWPSLHSHPVLSLPSLADSSISTTHSTSPSFSDTAVCLVGDYALTLDASGCVCCCSSAGCSEICTLAHHNTETNTHMCSHALYKYKEHVIALFSSALYVLVAVENEPSSSSSESQSPISSDSPSSYSYSVVDLHHPVAHAAVCSQGVLAWDTHSLLFFSSSVLDSFLRSTINSSSLSNLSSSSSSSYAELHTAGLPFAKSEPNSPLRGTPLHMHTQGTRTYSLPSSPLTIVQTAHTETQEEKEEKDGNEKEKEEKEKEEQTQKQMKKRKKKKGTRGTTQKRRNRITEDMVVEDDSNENGEEKDEDNNNNNNNHEYNTEIPITAGQILSNENKNRSNESIPTEEQTDNLPSFTKTSTSLSHTGHISESQSLSTPARSEHNSGVQSWRSTPHSYTGSPAQSTASDFDISRSRVPESDRAEFISGLRFDIARLRYQLRRTEEKDKETRAQLAALQAQALAQESEIKRTAQLRAELESMRARVAQMEEKRSAALRANDALQAQLQVVLQGLTGTQGNSKEGNVLSNLLKENTRLRTENTELREANKAYCTRISELNESYADLSRQNADLSRQNDELVIQLQEKAEYN